MTADMSGHVPVSPSKVPVPVGDLVQVPPVPASPHQKQHLDPFIRFRRVHGRDEQTHRQTTLYTPSVAIVQILVLRMRCNLVILGVVFTCWAFVPGLTTRTLRSWRSRLT